MSNFHRYTTQKRTGSRRKFFSPDGGTVSGWGEQRMLTLICMQIDGKKECLLLPFREKEKKKRCLLQRKQKMFSQVFSCSLALGKCRRRDEEASKERSVPEKLLRRERPNRGVQGLLRDDEPRTVRVLADERLPPHTGHYPRD